MSIGRQGLYFVLVGCFLIVADWLMFVLLTSLGVAAPEANVSGRMVGALLGFWLNGSVTFGRLGAPRLGGRRFVRFSAWWVVATLLSTVFITYLADHLSLHIAWAAKPLVEGCLAALSFFVSRHWVYR